MKKALILVLTNFFILTLILLGKPAKAQTTTITGQFLYGLQLYVLPEKQITPDYSTAIYSSTIDENDFITSGLYENWLQPRLPDGINGYIYLVDSSHTIANVYIGGGYLDQGQTLSYPYEPKIEIKRYNLDYTLISVFLLQPVNKIYFDSYGGNMDYIVYYETNDGQTPRIKLIDATNNENDYNRVKLAINGYDTGYNAGYSIGYNNGQVSGYENGYQDGQNNGYNTGYNNGQYDGYYQGYDVGYENGINDASQPGYVQVQVFNQKIQNGNFENVSIWNVYQATYSVANNIATVNTSAIDGGINQILQLQQNHYYYFSANVNANGYNCEMLTSNPAYHQELFINNEFTKYDFVVQSRPIQDQQIRIYIRGKGNAVRFYVKDVFCIDLTLMFGEGNEPTYEECQQIFKATYYPYNTGEPLNVNYIDGYNTGVAVGFDDGVSYQATQQLTTDGWIKNIFTGIGSFLAIEIIPNVSIGLIVGIPFIISVAWFVIKMARGGGNT